MLVHITVATLGSYQVGNQLRTPDSLDQFSHSFVLLKSQSYNINTIGLTLSI